MESETYQLKDTIATEIKEFQEEIKQLEEYLVVQLKQRPYNLPYIKSLQKEISFLQIQVLAYKDRLNKLDGCF